MSKHIFLVEARKSWEEEKSLIKIRAGKKRLLICPQIVCLSDVTAYDTVA